MKFTIYKVENGYLLNVYYTKGSVRSYIYTEKERMVMLAKIDMVLGSGEPADSVGMGAAA